MYYEVYIDVLFLVNFMMDTLLLLLVGRVIKCVRSYRHLLLASAAGAFLTCIVICSSFLPSFVKAILCYTAVTFLMIAVAFQIKSWRLFLKAGVFLYIFAFLTGGILQWLLPYLKTGSVFFAAAIVSFCMIKRIWSFITGFFFQQQKSFSITLFAGGQEIPINAFMDTGNCLRDPLSGEPVHILNESVFREKWSDWGKNGFRYISFRTVAGDGVIPVIRIEKMCVHMETGEMMWINHPVIGISKEPVFMQKEYQMLLNPEILGGI